jgi:putative membrane protein
MTAGWKSFLQRMVITTISVFIAEKVVDGVTARSMEGLIAAAVLLGLLNAFLRPVMMLLSLPLLLLTLGLFTFVINAVLLYLVGLLLRPDYFIVDDFWSAFKGGVVIGIVSIITNMMIGKKEGKVRVRTSRTVTATKPPAPKPPVDTGSGPVIDV